MGQPKENVATWNLFISDYENQYVRYNLFYIFSVYWIWLFLSQNKQYIIKPKNFIFFWVEWLLITFSFQYHQEFYMDDNTGQPYYVWKSEIRKYHKVT